MSSVLFLFVVVPLLVLAGVSVIVCILNATRFRRRETFRSAQTENVFSLPEPNPVQQPLYEATVTLLTPAERSFFGVLQLAVPSQTHLFAKVRLADVILPRSSLGASLYQSAFNKISSKHLDFVLCYSSTIKVLCAIELDDSSHRLGRRQARDTFVDAALEYAAIPMLRVNASVGYTVEKIRTDLAKLGISSPVSNVIPIQSDEPDERRYQPRFRPA